MCCVYVLCLCVVFVIIVVLCLLLCFMCIVVCLSYGCGYACGRLRLRVHMSALTIAKHQRTHEMYLLTGIFRPHVYTHLISGGEVAPWPLI